jgi:hypothetical protein
MHVFFISYYAPGPLKSGGERRIHQIFHELQESWGKQNVTLICSEEILREDRPRASFLNRLFRHIQRAIKKALQLFRKEHDGIAHLPAASRLRYRLMLQRHPQPAVCVIENPRLAGLKVVNDEAGIKTVFAPWSFETLTYNLPSAISAFSRINVKEPSVSDLMDIRAIFTSFADELIVYAGGARVWSLSKMEDAFLRSMGIASSYLPYYPTGEAEDYLRAIRLARRPEAGLFVICSGGNGQNTIALEDFLRRLKKEDIPTSSRIAITGHADAPKIWAAHLGEKVEFVGHLPDMEFQDLLARAHAVLIPQICGFGCMTRVADMHCAGIPVIADVLVANGTGEVPGVIYVKDTPAAWSAALSDAMTAPPTIYPETDFTKWLQAQRLAVQREFARVAI